MQNLAPSTSKQPSLKLIPTDPLTNSILILYLISPTGQSLTYKPTWRRLNPKRSTLQDIKTHQGASYKCSPLDVDCIIEVTVLMSWNGREIGRTAQSGVVRVARQVKERKGLGKDGVNVKISIDQMFVQVKALIKDGSIIFVGGYNGSNSISMLLQEVTFQADSSGLIFRMYFKSKFDEFLQYFSQLLGWKPQIKSQFFTITCNADLHRDVLLLLIAEYQYALPQLVPSSSPSLHTHHHQSSQPEDDILSIDLAGSHTKNKSQVAMSPANTNRQKGREGGRIAESGKLYLKKSMENINNNNKKKPEREYLNIFEEDLLETQSMTGPIPHQSTPSHRPATNASILNDQPSINLRGSFEQLERSFHLIEDDTSQKSFGGRGSNKKKPKDKKQEREKNKEQKIFSDGLNQQLIQLKRQNQLLRKQVQTIPQLQKQNTTLKKKYYQLNQQISRLQMQRKVILTDKLRCQVNWHRQLQEKQALKKQLDVLRAGSRVIVGSSTVDRNFKFNTIYDPQERKRGGNRSPNTTYDRSPGHLNR